MASAGGMLLGHDLSTVIQCEQHGTKYWDFDLSDPRPPELIVAAHGANLVRLRLWVNPPAGYSDLPSVFQFARRAQQANLKVLLCLHLSDYWADPGQQTTPTAWRDLDFNALSITVNNYVTFVIDALGSQGTPPFIVAVGNEVSNGVLWPIGSLSNTHSFTSLLKSGLAAVKSKGVASMIHINNGQDQGLVTWFMDLMNANNVQFDYLGLSFYPREGASLSSLEASCANVAICYEIPIVVVETADSWMTPKDPDAQAASIRDLLTVVSSVPRGLGVGVLYWESAWLPLGEAYPGERNHFWNRSLWDEHGRPLPALKCYELYKKDHFI
ncbi:hypothetical protein O6H91_20G058800 [Diphasiastrum complanatum]|uniref:Uncharacterized protein n=1 Tax=Diphasiastrum complanatum TaxID=34168 RepID=A0ACC2AQQ0_DIPCM|nr:hypothetical protein O6H91_20G058800 [Diphasiastrum complanatum]